MEIRPDGFVTSREVQEEDLGGVSPIESDGGSSSYYDLPMPDWLVDAMLERGIDTGTVYIKTEELIEVVFGNDFDFGNILKSLVRAKGVTEGAGKAGNSLEYEMKKVKYSADKVVKVSLREE